MRKQIYTDLECQQSGFLLPQVEVLSSPALPCTLARPLYHWGEQPAPYQPLQGRLRMSDRRHCSDMVWRWNGPHEIHVFQPLSTMNKQINNTMISGRKYTGVTRSYVNNELEKRLFLKSHHILLSQWVGVPKIWGEKYIKIVQNNSHKTRALCKDIHLYVIQCINQVYNIHSFKFLTIISCARNYKFTLFSVSLEYEKMSWLQYNNISFLSSHVRLYCDSLVYQANSIGLTTWTFSLLHLQQHHTTAYKSLIQTSIITEV